jgi:hypothetical protein
MSKYAVVKPTYEHNCNTCHFLGVYTTEEGVTEDLYICPNGIGTLLHRYGSEGPEYGSFDLGGMYDLNPLAVLVDERGAKVRSVTTVYGEIAKRATAAGLLVEKRDR